MADSVFSQMKCRFCFSLQSGPSLHGEDDVMLLYMVHIRDDITTFTQNSYLHGQWYDATEYKNLCERIEKALAAAKQSSVNADKLKDGDTHRAAADTIDVESEPSTSKLKNNNSTSEVKSLENMLKTLHSFHSNKEAPIPDSLQTWQSFDKTASREIASYTYSDSTTLVKSRHETKAMESTKALVNYTDLKRDLNEDKDKKETSTPLWNYADFIREIVEFLGKQMNFQKEKITSKELAKNEKESTSRNKQMLSIRSADEPTPAPTRRVPTRVDSVPAINENANPKKLFEKIVESNKLYRCPQTTNKRKESEDTRNLKERDRETGKRLTNRKLANIQTLIALSTRRHLKSKDSVVSELQLEEPFTDDELHELDLRPGDIFQFTLECLEHGYMVTLNEELVCVYPRLAHFAAVSHLAVAGDIGLHAVEVDGGQGPARHMLTDLEEDFDWTAVVSLNEQNFPQLVLGSGAMWVVCAYAAWCPACRDFAPRLERAAQELADHEIMVGAIDGDRSEQLMDDLQPIAVRVRDEPKTVRKPYSPLRRRGYQPGGGGYGGYSGGKWRALATSYVATGDAALNTQQPNEEAAGEGAAEAWHPAPCEEPSPRLVSASLAHSASTVVRTPHSGLRLKRRHFCSTM